MSIYMKKTFWAGAAERAIKTLAQAALALIGTNAVDITRLDWAHILAVAATAAVVSILTSLATPETAATAKNVKVEMATAPTPPPIDDPDTIAGLSTVDRSGGLPDAGASQHRGETDSIIEI
ncbi:holin [Mobiluncus curtisii]|uniref:holin n=1 Tax=Mobiluncus curtisii TaxID=2051 RepID=UPI00147047DC|nr:holin [Mobiluncus curtisii]NMW88043.1 hypothetical protein [Mobiluncus curtisii]